MMLQSAVAPQVYVARMSSRSHRNPDMEGKKFTSKINSEDFS
jgi:hypothetical protein